MVRQNNMVESMWKSRAAHIWCPESRETEGGIVDKIVLQRHTPVIYFLQPGPMS
jgi:hypothetical protein